MQVEQYAEFAVVVLPEVVDLTNAPAFKQVLQSLCADDCNVIKVDCSHLQMIDSAGLGSLVLYQKRMKERGGELKLINVIHPYIKHLFNMIELNRVINFE